MTKGLSLIPTLGTNEFALGVIGSTRTADPGAIRSLGVFAASTNTEVQRSAAALRTYAITIPYNTALSLRVLAGHVSVNDVSGKALTAAPGLATAPGLAINVPAGTTPSAIELNIAGKM